MYSSPNQGGAMLWDNRSIVALPSILTVMKDKDIDLLTYFQQVMCTVPSMHNQKLQARTKGLLFLHRWWSRPISGGQAWVTKYIKKCTYYFEGMSPRKTRLWDHVSGYFWVLFQIKLSSAKHGCSTTASDCSIRVSQPFTCCWHTWTWRSKQGYVQFILGGSV